MINRLSFTLYGLAGIALGIATACFAAGPEIPKGFTHIRTERDVSEYRLDANGLTVLLLPDHSAPAVSVLVTYHVGSRNESYGTTGATHLLEHLMFKGTQDHNKEAGNGFDQLLERTGAITNATTSLDRTNYFETVGSQDLDLAITLEADRMRNLRLREADRRPEMTVVRNEYERGENSPGEALEKEIWATAFLAHPYHHSTIGWRSDFEKVPIEKLRAFYDTFYWPNNATVTISGDFDPAAALELVKQHYGAIPRSPQPIPEVYTEEPPQTGPRRVTVKRPGELGIVTIAQKMPPATNADYAALDVLSVILADGRNSRMYLALTDKNLTTDVNADPSFNRDPALFLVSAQLAPGVAHEDVEHRLLDEIAHIQKDGVKSDEVTAAISKLTANTAYARDGSLARAFAISESIAAGDWRLYYSIDEAVKRVTPADVQRVAKKYFTEDQRVTGWFIPQDEKAGEKPDESAAATQKADEAASVGKLSAASEQTLSTVPKTAAPLKASAPAASAPAVAKIAPRVVRTRTSGIDLLVCPTGVKDVVTITGALPAFDPADRVLGELAAGMLERGTTKNDARAIATLLDQVGAQIRFSFEAGSVKYVVRCLKKDSAKVISLLAEQLRDPSFPADEFEKLKKLRLAETQQSKEDTEVQAAIAFRRAIFPAGHPLYKLTSDEKITALQQATIDRVKAFHHQWFGPEHCTMVVVGDADPTAIQAQVAKSFAGWTGGQPMPKVSAALKIEKSEELTVVVPGKESVNVILGAPSGLRRTDADYLPLAVGTSVLGHGFTSRLVGHVRDTEGLTYGITAELAGSGQLDHAWMIDATFAPSLLKQGLDSTRRELTAWHRDGITPAELDYRKSALAGEHRVSMATSGGLAEMILDTIRSGLELNFIDEYPAKISALTLDQINSVIRRRVDPAKLVIVRAGTLNGENITAHVAPSESDRSQDRK
jgi:zinc protease